MTTAYLYSFLATMLAGAGLILTQRWHGVVSLDSDFGVQKLHTRPTPRIGGLAVAAGLLIACAVAGGEAENFLWPMAVAAIPAFFAGLLEDLTKAVAVRVRLLATICSGVMAWALTGIAMQDTGLWGLDQLLEFLPLAVLFTGFVVGGVANAINIIDGFNGLATGVVVIMLGAMGMMAWRVGDTELATAAFLLVSIALGFGAVNWPHGRIFLGDGGAYLLGFLVAWVAVLLPMRHADINGWATLMACAYPVLEVLFSIRRRIKRQGHHPGQPDNSHLHHFLHRRVIRKMFPKQAKSMQNGLTGSLVWLLASLPALWAVVFFDNTLALVFGFFAAAFGYAALYGRLTQFVWCLQAATTRHRKIATI